MKKHEAEVQKRAFCRISGMQVASSSMSEHFSVANMRGGGGGEETRKDG